MPAICFLAYRIGRREWGENAGLACGAFVALYPAQVAFSHLLWSETLYCFLTLWGFERLLAVDRSERLRTVCFAGLLLGAASMTRSTGLGLIGISALCSNRVGFEFVFPLAIVIEIFVWNISL